MNVDKKDDWLTFLFTKSFFWDEVQTLEHVFLTYDMHRTEKNEKKFS